MKKITGTFILFILGWKTDFKKECKVKKSVMIAAPHTSNWDFIIAMAFYWKEGVEANFFIKDSWTKGLHGYFIKKMGGIGVARGKKNNLVDFAVNKFKEQEEFVLLVPAEATRKRVKKWKKGFYVIAKNANVPVTLGSLDYKKKVARIGKLMNLTDDFEADMTVIQNYYKNISAKFPENYNQKIF